MSARSRIVVQQRAWAEAAGHRPGPPGYLGSVDANLRAPMTPATLASFQAGGGAELQEHPRQPAKLRALYSSAALAVNVFDYWTGRDAAPLLTALGIDDRALRIEFEARFPIGTEDHPPCVDVAIALASGMSCGIECKFTEWHTPRRPAKIRFKEKYFPAGEELWRSRGLPACQSLAQELQHGATRFRFLYATQLLKHALGMASQCRDGFTLLYLYYDWTGPAAREHRREIEQFAARVGAELRFRALSYQQLHTRLRECAAEHTAYLDYLGARYFPA
ncbi:MAG: hypothetical protein P4L83_22315 [Nevskia sp.]|nr:hypothetical protein [Nevskia sp.]